MNGTNTISDYKNLISTLEDQELEAAAIGPTSPQIYGQLLAIYLLTNDLPNAKLLWKRIPDDIKEANSEIGCVWNVGVKLFKREFSEIYALVDSVEWPNHLRNIMNCLKEETRNRMINLIGRAYSSIRLTALMAYLGFDEAGTIEKVKSLTWEYDSEFVYPKNASKSKDDSTLVSLDEMTMKFTELISFLEN